MVNLRCSKCGSDSGFLIETGDGRTLEIKNTISTDRIMKTVRVTCTYCNLNWDQVPVKLVDNRINDAVGQRLTH